MVPKNTPNKTKNIEINITALNELGYGLGQKAGQIIMVARSAPGDLVQARMSQSNNKWTNAELLRVIKPGPSRIESPCKAFHAGCGGCQWLHLSYQEQLNWKNKNLTNILRTRAGYKGKINPIIGMENPFAYRNKLSLKNINGKLYFLTEFEDKSLIPQDCPVQTKTLQNAWNTLKTFQMPFMLEQLHLRSNQAGEIGIHGFIKDAKSGQISDLTSLMTKCPNTIGIGITRYKEYQHLSGEAALTQKIKNTSWLIPHNGFFQTNEVQAEVLLNLVKQESKIGPKDTVLDLYCGAGFFGLALALEAKEILGIEENLQSVKAAQESAKISGLPNVRFIAGDMGKILGSLEKNTSEIAIVDPPREGLLPQAIQAIIKRAPSRIVYISCYPQSLVRDYKALAAAGWRGVSCTPVDMFPHTSHMETVLTLERF